MALVLSRKVGQSLIVDETVRVSVTRVTLSPGSVSIAIYVPGMKRRTATAHVRDVLAIDEDVRLEPVEISQGEARLAIDAPRHVSIWRGEIDPSPAGRTDRGRGGGSRRPVGASRPLDLRRSASSPTSWWPNDLRRDLQVAVSRRGVVPQAVASIRPGRDVLTIEGLASTAHPAKVAAASIRGAASRLGRWINRARNGGRAAARVARIELERKSWRVGGLARR